MGGIRRACPPDGPDGTRHRRVGRVRHQATNAAPASDSAAEVGAPPISSGRRSGRSSSGPSNRSRRARSKASPSSAGAQRDDRALAAGGLAGHASTPRSRPGSCHPLLEPERRVVAGRRVRAGPTRGAPAAGVGLRWSRRRRSRRSAEPEGQQRLQVPIGDECLDLTAVPPTGGHRRSRRGLGRLSAARDGSGREPRPRSGRGRRRSRRSTSRRRSARWRAVGRRAAAPRPAGGARLLAPDDLGGRVGRARNGGRGLERLLRSPEAGALAVGDDVAGNAEEPDAERRGARCVLGPRSPSNRWRFVSAATNVRSVASSAS